MTNRAAVFLDRDGVVNEVEIRDGLPVGPLNIKDFVLVKGLAEDISRLKAFGFIVFVATNQPEISRGGLTLQMLELMHDRLLGLAAVDGIYVCPHDDHDGCNCRKPKPGLLLNAARDHDIDLRQSYMVGDRRRDIEAGQAAHCKTILVRHGYSEELSQPPDVEVGNLTGAVEYIVADTLRRQGTKLSSH